MIVTKENYKELIDAYANGLLTEAQENQLFQFLSLHPDIPFDFEDEKMFEADAKVSIDKSGLYFETINVENRNYFFIAYAENELSAAQKNEVDRWLAENPIYYSAFQSYQRLKIPVSNETFPRKWSLLILPERLLILPIIYTRILPFLLLLIAVIGGIIYYPFDEQETLLTVEKSSIEQVKQHTSNTEIGVPKTEMESTVDHQSQIVPTTGDLNKQRPLGEIERGVNQLDPSLAAAKENNEVKQKSELGFKSEATSVSSEKQTYVKSSPVIPSKELDAIHDYLSQRPSTFFLSDDEKINDLIAEELPSSQQVKGPLGKFVKRTKQLGLVGKNIVPVIAAVLINQFEKGKNQFRTTENGVTKTSITILGITIERTQHK